jgi:hypothetical protein
VRSPRIDWNCRPIGGVVAIAVDQELARSHVA